MADLAWFFMMLFICIFFANMSIIVFVGSLWITSHLAGWLFDNIIDYLILWNNKDKIKELPAAEE